MRSTKEWIERHHFLRALSVNKMDVVIVSISVWCLGPNKQHKFQLKCYSSKICTANFENPLIFQTSINGWMKSAGDRWSSTLPFSFSNQVTGIGAACTACACTLEGFLAVGFLLVRDLGVTTKCHFVTFSEIPSFLRTFSLVAWGEGSKKRDCWHLSPDLMVTSQASFWLHKTLV